MAFTKHERFDKKLTRMVIVEGYMDVVALAEYGIHYAVATLGTATSEHHIRRLFKVVPKLFFVLMAIRLAERQRSERWKR